MILALTTYYASAALGGKPFVIKSIAALLLMLTFVGTPAIAYLFTDVFPKGIKCSIAALPS